MTRPPDVTDGLLATAVAEAWGLAVASVTYLPVGYGSHHWRVEGAGGDLWFASVDVLDERSPGTSFCRLAAALAAADVAREQGLSFVVAPLPGRDGSLVRPFGNGYALALYPHVTGEPGRFDDVLPAPDVERLVAMLTALHDVPLRRLGETEVGAEESTAPGRDEVDAALSDLAAGTTWPGPYGARLRTLLGEHASVMAATLAEHDRLVAEAWPDSSRHVLSHGEPHPGNLIRTDAGPVLVDWETALLAPPERDLWLLDARSGGRAAELYVEVTGRSLDPRLLERYRLAWALADIGAYLHLLRHSAEETEDTAWSWRALQGTLEDLTVG